MFWKPPGAQEPARIEASFPSRTLLPCFFWGLPCENQIVGKKGTLISKGLLKKESGEFYTTTIEALNHRGGGGERGEGGRAPYILR